MYPHRTSKHDAQHNHHEYVVITAVIETQIKSHQHTFQHYKSLCHDPISIRISSTIPNFYIHVVSKGMAHNAIT